MKQEKLVAVTRECWHLLRRYHEEVFREKSANSSDCNSCCCCGGGGGGLFKGTVLRVSRPVGLIPT